MSLLNYFQKKNNNTDDHENSTNDQQEKDNVKTLDQSFISSSNHNNNNVKIPDQSSNDNLLLKSISSSSSSLNTSPSKRKRTQSPGSGFFAKRVKSAESMDIKELEYEDPKTIVCWNVNNLKNRLQIYSKVIDQFIERVKPQVIFISEVRLKAASPNSRGEMANDDKKSRDECGIIQTAFRTKSLKNYTYKKFSLASKRYAGTAVFVRDNLRPLDIWFELPSIEQLLKPKNKKEKKKHNEEGRIILTEWKTFYVLHTYSPNNGRTEDSFARRRGWDCMIQNWFEKMNKNSQIEKPIIYMGDLNVAPTDHDLTHPEWFKKQFTPACTGDPGDAGQPGCTPNEQARFFQLLQHGGLEDALRHFNKPINDPFGPWFTWRGHAGVATPEAGKYFKRGMRIDHVLASKKLLSRIQNVEICGKGESSSDPSFLGSDHCPVLTILNQ